MPFYLELIMVYIRISQLIARIRQDQGLNYERLELKSNHTNCEFLFSTFILIREIKISRLKNSIFVILNLLQTCTYKNLLAE